MGIRQGVTVSEPRERLRQRPDDLLALAAVTADAFAMPAEFVEKDFWVVELLRSLFRPSEVSSGVAVVFKGGTSLSKGFGLTQRFSEDVDILVVPDEGIGSSRIDRALKAIIGRGALDLGLDESQVTVGPSTTGVKRNARFFYPASFPATLATEGVYLEMGTRGGTLPGLQGRPVTSYIGQFLLSSGQAGTFAEEEPVQAVLLDPIRTLFEKLTALHAAAMAAASGDSSSMARTGRHYYDVHALLASKALIARLPHVAIDDLMDDIADVSARNGWAFCPRPQDGFASSPAFAGEGQVFYQARVAYQDALGLVYSEPPTFESCLVMIKNASPHL